MNRSFSFDPSAPLLASVAIVASACVSESPDANRTRTDSLRAEVSRIEENLATRYNAKISWVDSLPDALGGGLFTIHVHNALVAHGQPVLIRGYVSDIAPVGGDSTVVIIAPELASFKRIYFRLTASRSDISQLITDPPVWYSDAFLAVAIVTDVRKPIATWRPTTPTDLYDGVELEPDIATIFLAQGRLLDWKRVDNPGLRALADSLGY